MVYGANTSVTATGKWRGPDGVDIDRQYTTPVYG
jgi:hypothetical protein